MAGKPERGDCPGFGFKLITMISMATGTMLLMWLGEQIDDRGIGNGISLLIMVGIMAGFPGAVNQEIAEFMNDNRTLLQELFLIVIAFFIIAFVVALTQDNARSQCSMPNGWSVAKYMAE